MVYPRAIDNSHEETRPIQHVDPERCWLAADIGDDDWLIVLNDNVTSELNTLATFIEQHPVQQYQRRVDDYAMPATRDLLARLKQILDCGVGFGVLDRLEIDDYSEQTLVELYWLIGQLVGRPVAQKWNGEMIYNVRDTGKKYEYGVRGSHTAVELVFHTDNAFGMAMPEYVGLLCLHPAKSGGISRFCSLYTLHERIREAHPDALERLYQPMLYDRQKEHHPDGPPLCYAPFFSVIDGQLRSRANTSLVHKAYALIDEPMDQALRDALDVVDELSTSEDLWFEAPLQRGQVQYLNNRSTAHYRSAFEDYEEASQKRHLFRLWHRDSGATNYDGALFS